MPWIEGTASGDYTNNEGTLEGHEIPQNSVNIDNDAMEIGL